MTRSIDRRSSSELGALEQAGPTHARAVARERGRRQARARRAHVTETARLVKRLETEAAMLELAGKVAASERVALRAEGLRQQIGGGA